MMYIICNHDGSIKFTNLNEFVQKGTNDKKIFVAIEGVSTDAFTLTGDYVLPSGATGTLTGANDTLTLDTQTWYGKTLTLTTSFTLYSGLVKLTIKAINGSNVIIASYFTKITINDSALSPDVSYSFNGSQLEQLLSGWAGKQDRFSLNNVRYYDSVASANADISNLITGQVIGVKGGNTRIRFYYRATDVATTLTEIDLDYLKLSGGTLTGDLRLGETDNNTPKILFGSTPKGQIYFDSNGFIFKNGSNFIRIDDGDYFSTPNFYPHYDNMYDLGSGTLNRYWKDLYLKGNLKDGTKSVKVSEIAKNNGAETISGTWTYSVLPLTQANRSYNNDRQLADKEYADNQDEYYYGVLDAKIDLIGSEHTTINNKITAIENKIPTQASDVNKLADKDWVNSTINSLASFYITSNAQGDPFATYNALSTATTFYSGGVERTPTRNDYCLVNADETHDNKACRYIYQNGQWEFQFVVNDTPFTQAQLSAINSGITSVLVAQITTNQNAITTLGSNKLDKTEAQTTYAPRIEYKDISVATTDWNGTTTCIKATGITGLAESDVLEILGSTLTDEGYIGAYRVKMTAFDNTTGDLTMTCYTTPTEDILLRITITKNTKLYQ